MQLAKWADRAACKNVSKDVFQLPAEGSGGYSRAFTWADARAKKLNAAREYCNNCPVAAECKAYAERVPVTGIWAGEDELDRALRGVRIPALDTTAYRTLTKFRRASA